MLSSTQKKRGRPVAVHRMADGTPVPGLLRRADGRWKISATGRTFVEPDERLAVAKFYELTKDPSKPEMITVPVGETQDRHALAPLVEKARTRRAIVITAPLDMREPVRVERQIESAGLWAWFREQILTRPQYVAERTGIEQLGWLTDLKRPTASPTLEEIGKLYADKPGLSTNEAGRSKLFWGEFAKAVGVKTVRQLSHEHIGQYEAAVQAGGYAPKSILHRYRKVRTILAFAIKRGRGVEDCRRALDVTAMLEVKDAQPLDPKPISTADFWKIFDAAIKADDPTFAAMVLTAANCAMYAGEVSALKWDEIDLAAGELVTRRPKTGVSRVALLWPQTVKALKTLPRRGEYVFYTRIRSYTVFSALDAWRKYREQTGLKESVVFGGIRDLSFTVACRCSLDQARVLAGHRLPGMTDNYVRRDPSFVAEACRAIQAHLYAKPSKRAKVPA